MHVSHIIKIGFTQFPATKPTQRALVSLRIRLIAPIQSIIHPLRWYLKPYGLQETYDSHAYIQMFKNPRLKNINSKNITWNIFPHIQ